MLCVGAAPTLVSATLLKIFVVPAAVGKSNFGITVNGVKRTTMVPFSDMLNHYRPRETSWTFDDSQQSFTMTSLSPIKLGQQVMDSYGKKCNSKFLLHYGFAIETNREEDGRCQNEIFMEFKMPDADTDPHHSHRLQLAGPTLSIRCMMTFDEKRTQEAFSYNRLAVANQEELADIQVSPVCIHIIISSMGALLSFIVLPRPFFVNCIAISS